MCPRAVLHLAFQGILITALLTFRTHMGKLMYSYTVHVMIEFVMYAVYPKGVVKSEDKYGR